MKRDRRFKGTSQSREKRDQILGFKMFMPGTVVLLLGSMLACMGLEVRADTPPSTAPVSTEEGSGLKETNYEAIIRIENAVVTPDYQTPWNFGSPQGGNGTGFLIGPNRFLTNAHVVANARRLIVRKLSDPRPLQARVVHVAHDCDLALIELVDPSLFEGVKPLKIGGIPKLDTEVIAVGYPIGGDRISVTRGVVSRIGFTGYSHSSSDQHLAIQVDAAINPGNSGGPVLQRGEVIGVAFQGYSGDVAQNVGYIIPTPVVERFLKDIEDGRYDHYVELGISTVEIQNPAQIKALGLNDGTYGVYVSRSESDASGGDLIKAGDVMIAIDDNPIFSNGLIRVNDELLDMNEVVERKFVGDQVKVTVLRKGEKLDVQITLKRFLPYLIMCNEYDVSPRYIVHAGLVFQPLNRNLIAAHQLQDTTINYFYQYYLQDQLYLKHPEVVVLTSVLPDEINTSVSNFAPGVVEEINGRSIRTLRDAAEALKPEAITGEFLVIKLVGKGRPIVMEKSKIQDAHERILSRYQVSEAQYLGPEGESEEQAQTQTHP